MIRLVSLAPHCALGRGNPAQGVLGREGVTQRRGGVGEGKMRRQFSL